MNERVDKNSLYIDAYCNTVLKLRDKLDDRMLLKRAALYGVKVVNSFPKGEIRGREQTIRVFRITEIIKNLMAKLTPAEFENVFPITKIYDGDKTHTKDYFYSKDFMRTLPMDKPIGALIDELQWEYCNREVTRFFVTTCVFTNKLLSLEGQPGMIESFCNENGIDIYPLHSESKGKKFMVDPKLGRSKRIKKRLASNFKLIKS